MLSWTGAGAVERPRVLQIRLQRSYPGRVRAGAPVPARNMPTEEVMQNLRFFTTASPRGLPVDQVVFSGVGAASRPDLPALCAAARDMGVRRLTLHAGVEDLAGLQAGAVPVDLLVLPVQIGEAGSSLADAARVLVACRDIGLAAAANTQLIPTALPVLAAAARIAVRCGVASASFTFPFPVEGTQSGDVPPPARAVAALRDIMPILEGTRVSIKGLPRCWLGDLARFTSRTANRWYVDADHQCERGLLFFPDVVAFHKDDACRFCSADATCDGFFATYLRRPGFGRLTPLEAT